MTSSSTQPSITTQEQVDQHLRAQQVRAMVQTQSEVTPIPKEREAAFRTWLKDHNVTDLDHPDSHYDYRGAFLAGVTPDATGHWPDTFKQHGHPTFSVESQYSNSATDGGHWEDGKFVAAPTASATTQPTAATPNAAALEAFQQLSGDARHLDVMDAFGNVTKQNQASVEAFRDLRPSASTAQSLSEIMQQRPSFPIALFPGHEGPFDAIILGAAKSLKDAVQGAVSLVVGPPIPPEADTGAKLQKQSDIEARLGHPFVLTDEQMAQNQVAAAFVASSLVGGVTADVILAKMAPSVVKTALEGTTAGAAFGALRPKDKHESMLGAILGDAVLFGGLSLAGGLVGKATKPITVGVDALKDAGVALDVHKLVGTEYGKAIYENIQEISAGLDAKGLTPTPDVPYGSLINVTQAAAPDHIGFLRQWLGSPSHWDKQLRWFGFLGAEPIEGATGDVARRLVTNFRQRSAVARRLQGEWEVLLDEAHDLITKDIPAMGGGLTEVGRTALVEQREQALGTLLNNVFQPVDLPVTVPPNMVRAFTLIRNRLLAGREALRLFRGATADWGIDAFLPHVFVKNYWITDATNKILADAEIKDLRTTAMRVVAEHPGEAIRIIPRDLIQPAEFAGLGFTGPALGRLIGGISRALSVDGDEIASVLFENRIARVKPGKRFFGHAQARGDPPLAGWERNPFTALRSYAIGEARALAYHDAEQKGGALVDALAKLPGTQHDVEALRVYMDRVLGRPGKVELALRAAVQNVAVRAASHLGPGIQQIAEDFGDPAVLFGKLSTYEANIRLGYNPTAAIVNLSQTVTNTASAIGYGPTMRGVRLFLDRTQSSQVDALLRAMDIDLAVPLSAAQDITIKNIGQVSPWHPLYLFNSAEVGNRAIAGLAKYQEQILKGAGIRDALDAGRDFVKNTQLDYSVADAPRLLQGQLGGTLFQFKKFWLKEMEFIAQLPPAGKARFIANVTAIGGVTALFSLPPLLLANWAVGELTGETITERIQARFPRASRGLPGAAGVDLGQNVAIGSPSGFGVFGPSDIVGPGILDVFTLARDLGGKDLVNLVRSKQGYLTPTDKAQAIAQLAPVVARRLVDAYSIITSGVVRARGSTTLKFTPENATREAVLTAFGFTSLPRAEEQRVTTTMRREIQLHQKDEQATVQAWAMAYISGQSDEATKILEDAQADGLVITGSQLKDALAGALLERSTRGALRAPRELRAQELERLQQLQRP